MANISVAYSTISARADKKETLEAIGLLLDVHQDMCYHTEADYDESIILKEDGSFLFNISFSGDEEWSYECNVEHVFDQVLISIDKSDPKLSDKLKASFEFLDHIQSFLGWVWLNIDVWLNNDAIDPKLSEKLKAAFELLGQEAYEFELSFDFYNRGQGMNHPIDFYDFRDLNENETKKFILDSKDYLLLMDQEGSIFRGEEIFEHLNRKDLIEA